MRRANNDVNKNAFKLIHCANVCKKKNLLEVLITLTAPCLNSFAEALVHSLNRVMLIASSQQLLPQIASALKASTLNESSQCSNGKHHLWQKFYLQVKFAARTQLNVDKILTWLPPNTRKSVFFVLRDCSIEPTRQRKCHWKLISFRPFQSLPPPLHLLCKGEPHIGKLISFLFLVLLIQHAWSTSETCTIEESLLPDCVQPLLFYVVWLTPFTCCLIPLISTMYNSLDSAHFHWTSFHFYRLAHRL